MHLIPTHHRRANRGKGHSSPWQGCHTRKKHSPEKCPLLPGPMSSTHVTLAASPQRPLLRPRPQGPLLSSHQPPHPTHSLQLCHLAWPNRALSPFSDQHSRPRLLPPGRARARAHTHTHTHTHEPQDATQTAPWGPSGPLALLLPPPATHLPPSPRRALLKPQVCSEGEALHHPTALGFAFLHRSLREPTSEVSRVCV